MPHDGHITPKSAEIDERGVCRRSIILEEAASLFLERGYEGTTIEAVIERVGGSRRTIYEIFGGKIGLFDAMVEERCGVMRASIDRLIVVDSTPRAVLAAFGMAVAEMMVTEPGLRLYRLIVQESLRHPWLGERVFQTGIAPMQQRLADFLAAADSAGELRVKNPSAAAGLFIGMVKADLQMRALFCTAPTPCPEGLREHVDNAIEIFLNGVKA